MSAPVTPAPPSPPGLEALIAVAVSATSPQLVTEAIRTAYALGYFDAGVESMRKSIIHDERRTRDSSTLAQ